MKLVFTESDLSFEHLSIRVVKPTSLEYACVLDKSANLRDPRLRCVIS